jgi:hypothetical protein
VVSITPRPYFTPGKDPIPIVQEVRWAPGPVWTGGKFRSTGIRFADHSARSQSMDGRVVFINSRTPLIWTLVIRIRLALRVNLVENSVKLTCLEITGYPIKHSTVLWLLELQARRGRKV